MLGDIRRLTERCQEPLQKLEDVLVPELTFQISWDQKSVETSRLLCTVLGNFFCLTVKERREGKRERGQSWFIVEQTWVFLPDQLLTSHVISRNSPKSTEILTPVLQMQVQMKRNVIKLYSTAQNHSVRDCHCQGMIRKIWLLPRERREETKMALWYQTCPRRTATLEIIK